MAGPDAAGTAGGDGPARRLLPLGVDQPGDPRARRRAAILATAAEVAAGQEDAELDPAGAHLVRVVEYYHQQWEEETGNDQLKTHLRGPGKILRSRLPELVHQEIWAWLLIHHALTALTTRAAEAADLDPDRVSFSRALRIA